MEYKAVYTQEEVAELLEWFEQHSDHLPESMALGVEMNIPDVRKTVEAYIRMARVHGEDRSFSGPIYTLMRIRAEIEKNL